MDEVKTLMTAEDLWGLPEDGYHYELVKGELIRMSPPGIEHGDIASELSARLRMHAKSHKLGRVLVEAGFNLARHPDTVRGPDVAFLSSARIPPQGLPRGFFEGAPDLAVEIVSPSETASEVQEKVQDYLTHGTRLVWVVEPGTRTVVVYRADGSARLLRDEDTLEGEDVVPGFTVKVAELFE